MSRAAIEAAYGAIVAGLDDFEIGILWASVLRGRMPEGADLRDRAAALNRLRESVGHAAATRRSARDQKRGAA